MKTKGLLIFSLLVFSRVSPQDLTGVWEGNSSNSAGYVKLVIVRRDSSYVGYTYDRGMGYCKANFLGRFHKGKQLLTGSGRGFIEKTFGHSQGYLTLHYEQAEGLQYLKGHISPKTAATKILTFGLSNRVELRKVEAAIDTTRFMSDWLRNHPVDRIAVDDTLTLIEPMVTDQPVADTVLANKPTSRVDSAVHSIIVAKKERRIDTISTIVTSAKNIVITVFDNGQVDGDTITVFDNNDILLSRHFVSATPYKINLSLSKEQPRHEIMLVANNLGSIPPNTAVLLVEDGNKQYRLTALSDLKKNASVIFEYRE